MLDSISVVSGIIGIDMRKILNLFFLPFLILLTGCEKLALLDAKGFIAESEQHLLVNSALLMLIIVVPTVLLSFFIAFRYKRRGAKYTPTWCHSTKIEIVCWAVPCIIIAILATMAWISTHKLDPFRPLDKAQTQGRAPLVVQAVALDWQWLFIYPEQNIATVNTLTLPVDRPIRFLVTADAPMNAIAIPRLVGQIYAMPGMQTELNWIANSLGTYTGFSTNFSGEGFSNMYFSTYIVTEADFSRWVTSVQQTPTMLNAARYQTLAAPTKEHHLYLFSAPEKDLFQKIIAGYMHPHSNTQ
eukprot:TRINITY_DN14546_c0_g2_i1.p2 TRINITY_DN14546_c0_g2~~TRINITY_DN14546_c0_g2_i1.p2  ORF type:complete len:300 (+),score=-49.17 TRINITY_DN14546_c0_g2_i1:86-985(+)